MSFGISLFRFTKIHLRQKTIGNISPPNSLLGRYRYQQGLPKWVTIERLVGVGRLVSVFGKEVSHSSHFHFELSTISLRIFLIMQQFDFTTCLEICNALYPRCYLSNRPHFRWVYGRNKPRGMLGEHEKIFWMKETMRVAVFCITYNLFS